MQKKFLYLLMASFFMLSSNVNAATQFQIVSKVNNDIITLYDLESRSKLAIITKNIPNTKEARQAIAPQIMQATIEEKLKLQEIKKYKINVKDSEIKDAFNNLAKSKKSTPEELKNLIKNNNLDLDILYNQIKADIGWVKLVRSKARRNINISNDEILQTQKLLKENSAKTKYFISEIFIPANNDKNKAFKIANKLTSEIREVGMFNRYARLFSQTPTAANGGKMGLVIEGQLPNILENEIKKLKTDEISDPIFYNNGYYILKLGEVFNPKKDIENSIIYRLSQIIIPKDINLTQKGNISSEIKEFSGDCEDFNNIATRYNLSNSGDMGEVLAVNMPRTLFNEIKKLKKGEVSKSVNFDNGDGYIMICDKKIPSIIPPKKAIKDRLEQQKLELFVQKYLRDLKRTALIENK